MSHRNLRPLVRRPGEEAIMGTSGVLARCWLIQWTPVEPTLSLPFVCHKAQRPFLLSACSALRAMCRHMRAITRCYSGSGRWNRLASGKKRRSFLKIVNYPIITNLSLHLRARTSPGQSPQSERPGVTSGSAIQGTAGRPQGRPVSPRLILGASRCESLGRVGDPSRGR